MLTPFSWAGPGIVYLPSGELGEHVGDRHVGVLGLDCLEEQLGQAELAERSPALERQDLAVGVR